MSENNEIKEPLNKNNKVPKLRFKKFREDWVVVNFYSHFSYFSTNSLSWDELNYNSGDYLNLHYGIIHLNNSSLILSSSLPFINQDKLPKRFTLINEGDLILADTSEDRKDAAKGIEIINQSNVHILSGLHTIHLREKTPCTIPGFKTYYVASKSFRNFAKKYCEGIKVFSIKPSLLKYTHFAYPQNKNEQFKIVDFLNKIDDKKSMLEKKIDILKKYKKGLCNYLFINDKNSDIHLYDLVENNPSQMLTKDIEKNVGIYPVYDAAGKVYKNIDFYQQANDSVTIIKYGSSCGRTFISKGYHSILGTMTDLIPLNKYDARFLYAYTLSNVFRRIVKKYTEIGTTPNLYYGDYSKATIPLKAIANKEKISKLIVNIEEHEITLENQLNQLKIMKKSLLNLLFI